LAPGQAVQRVHHHNVLLATVALGSRLAFAKDISCAACTASSNLCHKLNAGYENIMIFSRTSNYQKIYIIFLIGYFRHF